MTTATSRSDLTLFSTLILVISSLLLSACGSVAHLVKDDYFYANAGPKLDAPDPSQSGPLSYKAYFYGSGTDKQRKEYGNDVDFKTESVDASPFVKIDDKKEAKKRKKYWGFDTKQFPINGRVWFPEGPGPFPLVLIVHGNHDMKEFSDPGYAYLGQLLSTRGYIFVSVDENFLNDLGEENDARGWMLLNHLKAWKQWNESPDHPFHGKVDMNNIALMGHSRGGECVAHAAAFNHLTHYPDDAKRTFDFNFHIKSLVAIAPCDQQYMPTGRPTPLENINYLLLHGGHDGDVSVFMGNTQYQRVKFTQPGPWFKTSLWIYRANHSRFNTAWGLRDSDGILARIFFNLKPILEPEEERKIACVYISAFLDSTLKGKNEYRPMFRDPRLVRDWLPRTVYESRYQDATFKAIADFEDDLDVTTTSLPGGKLDGQNLALWSESRLKYRSEKNSQENNVAILGWDIDEAEPKPSETAKVPSYTVSFPPGLARDWKLDSKSVLSFSLGQSEESLPDPEDDTPAKNETKSKEEQKKLDEEKEKRSKEREERDEKEAKEFKKTREPKLLDLTVDLLMDDGTTVSQPLSNFGPIHPPLEVRILKWKWGEKRQWYGKHFSEQLLQTYRLPLAAFSKSEPKLDPSKLKAIRFRFDRVPKGVIMLDDIGFCSP